MTSNFITCPKCKRVFLDNVSTCPYDGTKMDYEFTENKKTQLTRFIQDNIKNGLSWKEISTSLINKGWRKSDIEDVMYSIYNPIKSNKSVNLNKQEFQTEIQLPTIKSSIIFLLVFGVINFAVSVYSIYFLLNGTIPIGLLQLIVLFIASYLLFSKYRNYLKVQRLQYQFAILSVVIFVIFLVTTYWANTFVFTSLSPTNMIELLKEPSQTVISDIQNMSSISEVIINTNDRDYLKLLIREERKEKAKGLSQYVSKKLNTNDLSFDVEISNPDIQQILSNSIYKIDDKVFITKSDKSTLEKVSPHIAHLMIKKYFSGHSFNDIEPKTAFVTRQEFYKIEEPSIQLKLNNFDKYVKSIEEIINAESKLINIFKENINSLVGENVTLTSQRSVSYQYCLSRTLPSFEGANIIYRRIYTDNECAQQVSNYDQKIQENNNTILDNQKNLAYTQAIFDYDMKYYQQLDRNAVEKTLRASATSTLAEFIPDNTIYVIYEDSSNERIPYNFELIVHEYLHYGSFGTEGSAFSSRPVEEGLTEFFAENIILDNFHQKIEEGYKDIMPRFRTMIDGISKDDLINLYLRKDGTGLQNLVQKKYGNQYDDMFTSYYQ